MQLGAAFATARVATVIQMAAMPAEHLDMSLALRAHLGRARIQVLALGTDQLRRFGRIGGTGFLESRHDTYATAEF